MDKLNIKDIDKKLVNSTIFDKGIQLIKAKEIYVFEYKNTSYNVYSNPNTIYINEIIKNENDDKCYLDERIIKIDINNKKYKITRMKHDKFLSTGYVKSFDTDSPEFEFFKLEKIEALKIAKDILNNLSKVPNVDNIIDFESVYLGLDLELEIKDIDQHKDIKKTYSKKHYQNY